MTRRAVVSRGQGIHGSGSREYTVAEAKSVITLLKGAEQPLTIEEIADAVGMTGKGRSIRQLLSDFDGIEYLLAGDDDGVLLCRWSDEGDQKTRRLNSQAHKMLERVERRTRYAAAFLSRRQEWML